MEENIRRETCPENKGGKYGCIQAVGLQRRLLVQCLTFNLGSETPSSLPQELFSVSQNTSSSEFVVPDLYAFATQENPSSSKWQELIREHLSLKGLVLIASEQLLYIQILLFAKLEWIPFVDGISTAKVATGIRNVVGNKGAVSISLTLTTGQQLVFINSHFTAHDTKLEERKENYDRVEASLLKSTQQHLFRNHFPRRDRWSRNNRVHDESFAVCKQQVHEKHKSRRRFFREKHSVKAAQLTFWLGDLNYRVEGNREAVETALADGQFEVLKNNDQLRKERKRGRVFHGYQEGDLDFPPTYKFDKGSDVYDTSSKLRIPSWPDRILWKVDQAQKEIQVQLTAYHSLNQIKISDHRPVTARFLVHLNEKQYHPTVWKSTPTSSSLLKEILRFCFVPDVGLVSEPVKKEERGNC